MADGNPIALQSRRDPYRLTGEVFSGRYRIEAFVSSGGFGAVYRAVDTRLGKTVAVKILKPDLKEDLAETARELFQREALTAGRLVHPHIVNVTDVGEEFGFAYMVMEWLEGRTLEKELKTRKTFAPEDVVKILSDVADALHTAHEQGVIHRDIKPSNIHLGKEERTLVKVLDFGIAKVITSASQATASRIAGTLEYASPEQIKGDKINRRSDIYSLGVMIYQMLTGELPFKANSEAQLIQMHLMEQPPRLSEKRSDLPESTSAVVEKAMAKYPEERFQSALELKQAFIESLSQPNPQHHLSEMDTLLAATKASPVETETHSTPKDTPQPQRLEVQFAQSQRDLKTDVLKPIETHETNLQDASQEKQIEQTTQTPGKRYALRYIAGGAIFMLVFRFFFLQEFFGFGPTVLRLLLIDVLFGAFLGAALSEMRPLAWWSVAKHRRLKAFAIYAATGAALLQGGAWLLFHFYFFFLIAGARGYGEFDYFQYYVNQYAGFSIAFLLLVPIGIIVGLAACSLRVALSSGKEEVNKEAEIKASINEEKSKLNLYLILGGTILFFIISLIYYLIVVGLTEYPASRFRVIYDTILGAAFGAIVAQLLRPSARWSITEGYQGKSILLHGSTSLFVISFATSLQLLFAALFYFSSALKDFYFLSPLKDFSVVHYNRLGGLTLFRSTLLFFTVGVLIWFARILAHKTKRYGLFHTLFGALCSFALSYFPISFALHYFPISLEPIQSGTWLYYALLNTLIGAMFFASLSELRSGARWSTVKGRRVKAFLVHGATGITIVMGVGWLLSYFYIFAGIFGFSVTDSYILLAILALIGFILGLIVCGVRIMIQTALPDKA